MADVNQILAITEQLVDLICNEAVDTKVEHPGILELGGKEFTQAGKEHFIKLAEKIGHAKVTRALLNLERWNKDREPSVSHHAKAMIDAVAKHFEKKQTEAVEVKAEHPGILQLKDKDFLQTGPEHFIRLSKSTNTKDGRSGRQQVTNALLNLERWNKKRDPKTSEHAKKMIAALEKHFGGEKSEGY